jgi:hypothetical protein
MVKAELALNPMLHALYYLAEVSGGGFGYHFRLEGFGVYSSELARDVMRGRVKPIPLKAARRICELVTVLCGDGLKRSCSYAIIVAARVHFIATRVYPPVDDPVEYASYRFPGMDRWVAEYALKALRHAKLL